MKIKNTSFREIDFRLKDPMILLVIGFFSVLNPKAFAQQNSGTLNGQGFRASVVKINISPGTPKQLLGYGARLSTGIHDSIHHRIIALDDGTTQFFLVSSEVCLIAPSEYDHVAELLQKKLGINPVNFWWSTTHTHSAPEVGVPGLAEAFMGDRYKHPVDTAYTNFIEQTLINGIVEARAKLAPARLGVGWGFSQANINRRAIDENGKASIGLNPDAPVDRRIGIIRLEKQDGSPLAIIANYPIHGTVLGDDFMQISGDVLGVVSTYAEQKTGVPVLFINGAAGNLAPIYSVYPNPEDGHLDQFRVLLGDRILEANKKIRSTSDSVKLFTGALTVESPRKANLGWPSYLGKYSTTKNGINLVKLPVRFLKINDDVAIWSAPIELFCEISNEVRDRSPFPFTFYYGYTNGWLGYLPSEAEWKYGGYEVETVSPFTKSMSVDLSEAVTGYLQGEMRSTGDQPVKAGKKR
ncbi:MAG: neutral/alkaline non-lysosomal ceramidase N-terminal domain-containing protein [Ferruginibacter sp.]